MEDKVEERKGRGVPWRVAFTIVTMTLWLVFMLYWIGFLWARYEVGQSIASLCISSVVFAGLNALAWTLWPARRN